MTYREKLKLEHPDNVGDYIGGCEGCPAAYDYGPEHAFKNTCAHDCWSCWDREYTKEQTENKGEENMNTTTTKKNKADLLKEIADLKGEVERLDRYKQYEKGANEAYAFVDSFVQAGFTREEAFELLKTAMSKLQV